MKKLLQINATSNWGSTGVIAEYIGKKAIETGWDSYIAYGRFHNPSVSKEIKVGNRFYLYEHFFENKFFDNEGLASKNPTKKLILQIKNIKPDIIHLHNVHDHWINYAYLFEYLNKTNIKVVWTFHDFWGITGHCAHFIHSSCYKWKIECCNCPLSSFFADRSKRNFHLKKSFFVPNKNLHIVAVSDWVKHHLLDSFLKDKDIQTINNGVSLSTFRPRLIVSYPDELKNKFVILSVASQWKFGKGWEDYIKMSHLLDEDEVIVLVGVNEKLKKLLPRNIIGINRTNNVDELVDLYNIADVVTSFSSAETFGLTIIEGYACGTPAVVYKNTALPFLVESNTGFVVPDKDYKAAYKAIKSIKLKGKKFYSDNCINLVKDRYSIETMQNQYMNLYENLITPTNNK